jgi:hypothetical protein
VIGASWENFVVVFTPGHAFRDGKLYSFTSSELVVIRPWGRDAGAWRFTDGGWRPYQPVVRLRVFARKATDAGPLTRYGAILAACYREFLACIPPDVLRVAMQFPRDHWPLLQFFNRFGAPALDLAVERILEGWGVFAVDDGVHVEVEGDAGLPRFLDGLAGVEPRVAPITLPPQRRLKSFCGSRVRRT